MILRGARDLLRSPPRRRRRPSPRPWPRRPCRSPTSRRSRSRSSCPCRSWWRPGRTCPRRRSRTGRPDR
ncbi:hypothetical protein F1C15_08105 [Frigoribacterium sp. NBH87]|nr:hypothetical protein F1C15_08105 [Frigoribacterium sp. NBH87]